MQFVALFSLATTGFPVQSREIAIPRKEPGQSSVLEKIITEWCTTKTCCKAWTFRVGALGSTTELQSSGQLLEIFLSRECCILLPCNVLIFWYSIGTF